jgi:hypothetical protein
MNALVFFECPPTVLLRVVIHQLVARRTHQHQIADIVDIYRPPPRFPTRTFDFERDDVRHLTEDPLGKRHVMPKHVLVASVELTPASRSNEEE